MAERSLALSCPEAARLVLLGSPLSIESPAGQAGENPAGAQEHFRAARSAVLRLLRNPSYPLWQRLFLLNILSRRLDGIAQGELGQTVAEFLADFEATVAEGSLRAAMENLPVDGKAQLDVVLRLAGMMLHKSNISPRFVECIQAFTAGIGNGPGATLDSLAAHFAFAHDRFYAPFMKRHPHMLENYLVNLIVRRGFPRIEAGVGAIVREFTTISAQLALIRGLLIGVAGAHGKAFSASHVVHTVQAASKHFEHHPEFQATAHAMLVECRMDGALGLAILLRSAEPHPGRRQPETGRPLWGPAMDAARPATAAKFAQKTPGETPASAPAPAATAHPQ